MITLHTNRPLSDKVLLVVKNNEKNYFKLLSFRDWDNKLNAL